MAALYPQAFIRYLNTVDMPVARVQQQTLYHRFAVRLKRFYLIRAAAG
jgi:hypothetical protein